MKSIWLICIACIFCSGISAAAAPAAPKMRPYAGIGILLVSINESEQSDPLFLYDEPALFRRAELNRSTIPPYDWIFGTGTTTLPLIVVARKGTWLRVVYDDAGREAWLNPSRTNAAYHPWNMFFKMHVSKLLPGLNKKYYQLYLSPGKLASASVTASQIFKTIRLDHDWAQVVLDQKTLAWVRWRDEDGRLLMGIATPLQGIQP